LEQNISRGAERRVKPGRRIERRNAAEAAAIDAQLRQPSVQDLLRKIETLEARLASAPESDPAEEQKRSKRAADRSRAVGEMETGAGLESPAIEGRARDLTLFYNRHFNWTALVVFAVPSFSEIFTV
jgi:hypothetical protein